MRMLLALFQTPKQRLVLSCRDGDVAHRGCRGRVLGKFDDNRSITTDLCINSQSKTLPFTSNFCNPTQQDQAHVCAEGAARCHAQLHVQALVSGYIPVDIGSSTDTTPVLQYFSIKSILSLISDFSDIVKETFEGNATIKCPSSPIGCAATRCFRITRSEVMSPKGIDFLTVSSFISVH